MRRVALLLGLLPLACHAPRAALDPNPACAGFDAAGSDASAIALADEVMRAMGGRAAWDRTRVLCWTFFGRRSHVWDKWTGDYRLEEGERVVLLNLASGAGRVFEKGVERTDAAEVARALQRAKSVWINDSYWLVMPYKLKDSGVTLKCAGESPLDAGRVADVLELTFAAVGDTPQNRYEVLVARDTHLVEGWRYFAERGDEQPKLSTPWRDWRPYGAILLSGDRGERKLDGIAVLDAPPASLFAP